MNSDLDHGIENNLDAALIQNKMHDNVKYEVKSGGASSRLRLGRPQRERCR